MKKIKILLTIILTMTFMVGTPVSVFAAGITTSISGPNSISTGQSFTVKFSLNAGETISAFTARVNFPKDLLSVESVSKHYVKDFNTSTGAITSNDVLKGSYQFLSITFKSASSFTAGKKATVSLTEFVASNETATARLTGNNSSQTITAVAPKSSNNNLSALSVDGTSVPGFSASKTSYNLGSTDKSSVNVTATRQDSKASISGDGRTTLAYGSNTIRVVVKAENGSSKTYSITINKNDDRSSNNFLSSIKLSSGEIQFDKNRNNYTLIVANEVTKLNIDVVKEDAKASIKNTSVSKDLDVYSNMFEFTVIAENNTKRVYSINVVRRDVDGYAGSLNTNNNLESLTVEGYEFQFNPETLTYDLQVEHAVSTLTVNAVVADETASLVLPNSFDLALGENTFDLTVIAQDETQKVYKLNVMRARNVAPLPIDELIAQLDTIEADILNVALVSNNPIDEALLAKLKATSKDVAFHVLDENNMSIGYWKLTSDQLSMINTFNPNVRFLNKIPQSLNELINYAQSLVLTFDHEGAFDHPIKFVLPLQGSMDESYLMNVYYYNEETSKLENVAGDLEIVNDEIVWEMNHASIYVITPALLSSSFSFDSLFTGSGILLIVALVLLTLSLLGNLVLLLKVKKLTERLFARNFDIKKEPKQTTLDKQSVVIEKQTEKSLDTSTASVDQNKKENT